MPDILSSSIIRTEICSRGNVSCRQFDVMCPRHAMFKRNQLKSNSIDRSLVSQAA